MTVGYSQLRSIFPPETVKLFTHHKKPVKETALHLVISKKAKRGQWFLEKFNSGLKKLKENGEFDEIVKEGINGKYDKKKVKWVK